MTGDDSTFTERRLRPVAECLSDRAAVKKVRATGPADTV